jgi:hypothetical protein
VMGARKPAAEIKGVISGEPRPLAAATK